jgi:GTPase SAR1 family protein
LCTARVGKTSLLKRYVENKFSSDQISTIDATFLEKTI